MPHAELSIVTIEVSKNDSQNLPDRLYRSLLIVAAALMFGLLFYWIVPDVTPIVGETGAALWSWLLIIVSGIAAHRWLPKTNMTPVSRVLFAVLMSTLAAMLTALVFALVVELSVDQGELPQVFTAVGFSAFVFASIVFIPIYLTRKKLGRTVAFIYLLAGTMIPAGCVMVWQPLGKQDLVGNLMFAAIVGLVGGCSAIGFAIANALTPEKLVPEP